MGPGFVLLVAGRFGGGQPGAKACRRVIAVVVWVAQGQVAAMRSRSRRAADHAPGGREQAQPQAFGFPRAGGAVEGEHLHPGGQLAGHRDQLAPDLVLVKAVQGYL